MLHSIRALAAALAAIVMPSVCASQSNEWLLTSTSAGKVTIGMTVDALYSAYGRDNVRLVDLFGEGMFDPALQVYLPFEQGAPMLVARISQICGQYHVIGVDVHSARFRTRDGIGVGSTVAEVRKRYPEARLNREEGPSLIVEPIKLTLAVANTSFADSVRVVKVWTWGQRLTAFARAASDDSLGSARPHNEQLLLSAHVTEAAGSLRSPAAFSMIAPQQNCGR